MNSKRIYLSLAEMSGNEIKFIQEAFDTNWIAPLGPNVNEFEKSLKSYLYNDNNEKLNKVVALNSGTSALHLALLQLGVGKDDEVICQSFTFVATANAINYLGATPVFVDSDKKTWNIDPDLMEEAIICRKIITGKFPKAIVFVNLYGMPAQIDKLIYISEKYNIPLLEDAAESLGSKYKGRYCGTFGDFGVLSFNGNKIITTSGGGALICKNQQIAQKTIFYASQSKEERAYYEHKEIGYNYRMSNISAGIGRGQMMALDSYVEARKRNHRLYVELFRNIDGITIHENPSKDYDSNFWLTCILIDSSRFGHASEEIRLALESENIETRPLWKPMHIQPLFINTPYYGRGVSENLFKNGLCLPSGAGLTRSDIERVVGVILRDYKEKHNNRLLSWRKTIVSSF